LLRDTETPHCPDIFQEGLKFTRQMAHQPVTGIQKQVRYTSCGQLRQFSLLTAEKAGRQAYLGAGDVEIAQLFVIAFTLPFETP
jgi:hypothetical protein